MWKLYTPLTVLAVSIFVALFLLYVKDKGIEMSSESALIEELKNNPNDPNSFARPDKCIVTNILWNVTVNFGTETISGFVELTYEKKDPSVDELILDASNLTIYNVIDIKSGQKLQYQLSDNIKIFGSKFTIKLPSQRVSTVRVTYETSSYASALQWLKPEQTAGKKRPYMFSQCEAIHCRSMMPIQDTPSVKAPYKAVIRAPKDLVVLLSAVRDGNSLTDDGEMKEFRFTQSVPIQSYLFAIVVGALESRSIGPRSSVWSEKEFVDRAAYEFGDTEKMLMAAESMLGPYVWGIYDLLVLPPSFPYGGMENPCLTFVTPTLLAGDRSMANVVAHEIAHSWTGNLVTNRNFQHFWLNEGFTTFMERKINGRLYGGEPQRQFLAIGGLKDMKYDIDVRGHTNPLTKLVVDLKGVDPDDAFSVLPYEKGHTFLFYLEQKLGGPKVFEPFLRTYIDTFKYKSIETNDFKTFFLKYFNDKSAITDDIDWDQWLCSPGMPPVIPQYDTSLVDACTALAKKWNDSKEDEFETLFNSKDIKSLNAQQIREFLAQLLGMDPPLSERKVKAIVDIYGLKSKHNSEIRFAWIRLGLTSHWKECIDDAIEFVTSQGRLKYVRPIFRDLYAWDETRDLAIATYKKHKDQWMYLTSSTVAKDLQLN